MRPSTVRKLANCGNAGATQPRLAQRGANARSYGDTAERWKNSRARYLIGIQIARCATPVSSLRIPLKTSWWPLVTISVQLSVAKLRTDL